MILCPNCQEELSLRGEILECPECLNQVNKKNGIFVFHPHYSKEFSNHTLEGLEAIHSVEDYHFWFRTRAKYIVRIIKKFINKDAQIIDIGAGSGNVSRILKDEGYKMAVGEIQLPGLYWAKKYGIKDLYQFDLNLPVFRNHFDVVCLFDVLEHLENDDLAIKSVKTMLREKGKVVITVPAHKWLWNKRDVLERHRRRYELKEIKDLFLQNGFKIIMCKHFFVSILPLLVVRKFFSCAEGVECLQNKIGDNVKINPLVNKLLYYMVTLENLILGKFSLKIGGSITVVAEKA